MKEMSRNMKYRYNITLCLVMILLFTKSYQWQVGPQCAYISKSGYSLVPYTGVQSDPNIATHANVCGTTNKFRVALIFKLTAMPATGTTAIVFSYYDKIKIYFEQVSGKNYLRVWKHDEPSPGVIHSFEIFGANRWFFVWYELSNTKSEVAMRHSYPWDLEEHRKQTYTLCKN